ncbi:MAG: hypothetical protein ACE5IA_07065 [Dehalococcoidia bacterium]
MVKGGTGTGGGGDGGAGGEAAPGFGAGGEPAGTGIAPGSGETAGPEGAAAGGFSPCCGVHPTRGNSNPRDRRRARKKKPPFKALFARELNISLSVF